MVHAFILIFCLEDAWVTIKICRVYHLDTFKKTYFLLSYIYFFLLLMFAVFVNSKWLEGISISPISCQQFAWLLYVSALGRMQTNLHFRYSGKRRPIDIPGDLFSNKEPMKALPCQNISSGAYWPLLECIGSCSSFLTMQHY